MECGGTYTLTLQYNTAYTVEIEEASKSWIHIPEQSPSTATLEFLIAPNPGLRVQAGCRATMPELPRRRLFIRAKQSRQDYLRTVRPLGGSSWAEAKKTNWNTEEPVETWGGVTVEEGKVTQLNLSGFGLTGQLPAAIGSLTDLTRLNIGSNTGLTGPLPSTIGDLVNLDALMAVTTGLEGPLPASMGNLKTYQPAAEHQQHKRKDPRRMGRHGGDEKFWIVQHQNFQPPAQHHF